MGRATSMTAGRRAPALAAELATTIREVGALPAVRGPPVDNPVGMWTTRPPGAVRGRRWSDGGVRSPCGRGRGGDHAPAWLVRWDGPQRPFGAPIACRAWTLDVFRGTVYEMSSESDHPRQRTVAELLAAHGDGTLTGRRARRRAAEDAAGGGQAGPGTTSGNGAGSARAAGSTVIDGGASAANGASVGPGAPAGTAAPLGTSASPGPGAPAGNGAPVGNGAPAGHRSARTSA